MTPPRTKSRSRRTPRAQETPEQATQRRSQEKQRLAEAITKLKTSAGWQAWLDARGAFHAYSFNNCLLIAMQCPEATRVAGFHAWKALGRSVRKGERAIVIAMPAGAYTTQREDGTEETHVRFRHKAVLFDCPKPRASRCPSCPANRSAVTATRTISNR